MTANLRDQLRAAVQAVEDAQYSVLSAQGDVVWDLPSRYPHRQRSALADLVLANAPALLDALEVAAQLEQARTLIAGITRHEYVEDTWWQHPTGHCRYCGETAGEIIECGHTPDCPVQQAQEFLQPDA